MNTTRNTRASQDALKKQALRASTVWEAAKIGRCYTLCNELGLREFDLNSISKMVELRPSLDKAQSLVTWVPSPEGFVVVKRDHTLFASLIEIGDEVIWSFDDKARSFENKATIMDSSELKVFAHLQGH